MAGFNKKWLPGVYFIITQPWVIVLDDNKEKATLIQPALSEGFENMVTSYISNELAIAILKEREYLHIVLATALQIEELAKEAVFNSAKSFLN